MKFTALLRNRSQGLTLVELLIVIAIIGIISSISFLSLLSFNKRQKLVTVTGEIFAAINSTKSKAQSQVKPDTGACASGVFRGYNFVLIKGDSTPCLAGSSGCYYSYPVCSGVPITPTPSQVKNIPSDISVNSLFTFTFEVLNGTITQADPNGTSIILSNSSESQSIILFRDGRISLNQ